MKRFRCAIIADSYEELEERLGMFDGAVFTIDVSSSTSHLIRDLFLLHSDHIVSRHRRVTEEGAIEHTIGFVDHQM